MDKKDDSVLSLLQDIKEILLGIALILTSVGVGVMGRLLEDAYFDVGAICLIANILLFAYGGVHVWNGWNAHRLTEKNAKPQKQEEQGGPHAH